MSNHNGASSLCPYRYRRAFSESKNVRLLAWADGRNQEVDPHLQTCNCLRQTDQQKETLPQPMNDHGLKSLSIRPRMEYACAVWSGGPTGCFQRLQNSFAKRHSLSLPPLEKRYEYHTLVLFYRVRANLAPTYLSSLVPPLTSTKSGYSFRKNPTLSPLPKVCNVKQLFAPCNHFMEQQRCSHQTRC